MRKIDAYGVGTSQGKEDACCRLSKSVVNKGMIRDKERGTGDGPAGPLSLPLASRAFASASASCTAISTSGVYSDGSDDTIRMRSRVGGWVRTHRLGRMPRRSLHVEKGGGKCDER